MTLESPISARSRTRRRLWATTALGSAAAVLLPAVLVVGAGPVSANPEGGRVVGGAASIEQGPGTTVVRQASERAVIDWRAFSIGGGELTRFEQPGREAIALNRVRGGGRSELFGRLEANGQVWLVNPAGVLVGPGARIDVAGFLATTADIPDADFLAGRFEFSIPSPRPDASVVNQGTISLAESGLAALVAPHARNDGVIEGRLGQVVVAGAPTFALDLHGDGLIAFEATSAVTQAAVPGRAAAENAGLISVEGGRVLLAASVAQGVVEGAINMSGVIEATSVAARTGEIVLAGGGRGVVAVTGRLDASGKDAGETGGVVKVLGEKVGLFDGAVVDASGAAGGGTVLIGGNYQGRGPEPNAKRTYIAAEATIDASATEGGDGGRVIVWGDEWAQVDGRIAARGGPIGGDGGFVETSSRGLFGGSPKIDVHAPAGTSGTWLLDPENVIIGFPGSNEPVASPPVLEADFAGLTVFVTPDSIENFSGGTVLIQASNDITVASPVDMSEGNDGDGNTAAIELDAGQNIEVDTELRALNTLTLRATNIRGTGTIAAPALSLQAAAPGGAVNLTRIENVLQLAIGPAAGVQGSFATVFADNFVTTSAAATLTIGPVGGIEGIVADDVDLVSDGSFLITRPVTVSSLNLQPGTFVGNPEVPAGIPGNVTQTAEGVITADSLSISLGATDSASIVALTAANRIGSFFYSGGEVPTSVALFNTRDLDVLGIDADTVDLGVLGRLTLSGPIVAESEGTSILIVADAFTNNAGSEGLSPGAGRFLVFSQDPDQDVLGGLPGGILFLEDVDVESELIPSVGDFFVYAVGGEPATQAFQDIPPSVDNPTLETAVLTSPEWAVLAAPPPQLLQVPGGGEAAADAGTLLFSNDGNWSLWGLDAIERGPAAEGRERDDATP